MIQRIGGVMVSVVDHGSGPGRAKPKTITLVFVT
jgi:hypothetical protein